MKEMGSSKSYLLYEVKYMKIKISHGIRVTCPFVTI